MVNKRPIVIEKTNGQDREYDIYSRLLKERIIFLDEQITSQSASVVVAQLLFLQMESPNEDIIMYINSPGGGINAGLTIIDTMNYISCDVSTVVIGTAASMASVIASSGAKGKRFILPHSEFLIHQARGETGYNVNDDLQIAAKHMDKLDKILINVLSQNTGKSFSEVEKAMERDNWMSAEEAVKYGLCDEIITKIEM